MSTTTLFRIAVIGLGDCGIGLTERLSTTGLMVRATDSATKHLARARTVLKSLRSALVRTGLLVQEHADAATRQTSLLVNRTEALERAELVFDVREGTLEQRKEHIVQLAGEIADSALIIVCQPPAEPEVLAKLAAGVPHPERVLALELTEFPSLLRRGRLLTSAATTKHAVNDLTNLLLRCGLILDSAGVESIAILRRLYAAVARESCEILAEQKMAPAQLDEIIRTLVGPMLTAIGPLEYAGAIGLDAAFATVLKDGVSDRAQTHLRAGGPDRGPLPLPEHQVGEDGLAESMRRLSRIQMNLS